MAPKRSEGATNYKGLRIINYVVPCVLIKSNFLRPLQSSCAFVAACNKKATRKCSSNIPWLAFTYLTLTSIQSYSDAISILKMLTNL